jgi:hypothetical protein
MSCQYAQLDGVYVLGALAPAERQEFEVHLRTCEACSRAVQELAGLPGLMARVDAEILSTRRLTERPPDTLWPDLLARVRRSRRRRTFATAGLAAAAAAAIVLGSVVLTGALSRDQAPPLGAEPTATSSPSPSPSETPMAMDMKVLGDSPVTGAVALESVAWGTRLTLTCTYPAREHWYDGPPPASYAMVVRTGNGQLQEVASWRPVLGKTMQVEGATSTTADKITLVEVRDDHGYPVLRLRR